MLSDDVDGDARSFCPAFILYSISFPYFLVIPVELDYPKSSMSSKLDDRHYSERLGPGGLRVAIAFRVRHLCFLVPLCFCRKKFFHNLRVAIYLIIRACIPVSAKIEGWNWTLSEKAHREQSTGHTIKIDCVSGKWQHVVRVGRVCHW